MGFESPSRYVRDVFLKLYKDLRILALRILVFQDRKAAASLDRYPGRWLSYNEIEENEVNSQLDKCGILCHLGLLLSLATDFRQVHCDAPHICALGTPSDSPCLFDIRD